MDITARKTRAMSKREVKLLLSLIQAFPILLSKDVTAVTNKLKDQAWDSVTQLFNEKKIGVAKVKEQLKFKWDNLKRAAKKKAVQMSMSSNKLDKSNDEDNFKTDNILKAVVNLLGLNCDEFDEPLRSSNIDIDFENSEDSNEYLVQHIDIKRNADDSEFETNTAKRRKDSDENQLENSIEEEFVECIPTISESLHKFKDRRKKKIKKDDGRLARNLAIAKFYQKRAEKLDVEIELLKIELAKKKQGL